MLEICSPNASKILEITAKSTARFLPNWLPKVDFMKHNLKLSNKENHPMLKRSVSSYATSIYLRTITRKPRHSVKRCKIQAPLSTLIKVTTPFCNWRWPIAKTDSTQEQNSAPHPAVGAERLADVRNNWARFGFSSSFSITSTLCVKNGISSKHFGIHSKQFDKVPPTFEPM